MADDYEDDGRPPVTRPAKNINIFITNERSSICTPEIFDGKMGPLPLLLSVDVGYDPEDPDPYMHHYESQEVMFAYKKDVQKRVLIRDSMGRTLSLPVGSTLLFNVDRHNKEMTVAQIVAEQRLPLVVEFARPECLHMVLDRQAIDPRYFGHLTLSTIYDEPFFWCLAVNANGTTKETPIVLPLNLHQISFCPVVGIIGALDPAAKVQEFVERYSQVASNLTFDGDPFFQELAIISPGPDPVYKVKPYIKDNTFVTIDIVRRPAPDAPSEPCPPPPPRAPLPANRRESGEGGGGQSDNYTGLSDDQNDQAHVYAELRDLDVSSTPPTNVVKPFQKEAAGSSGGRKPPAKGVSSSPLTMQPFAKDGKVRPALPARNEEPHSDIQSCNVKLMASPAAHIPRALKAQLNALSVEDVVVKLKQLGLQKHGKKFRKNRIDGLLLQKLTEEDLKREFGMSHMEFLLLNTFITEG
ncbi:uncharacterized protein LOC143291135 isoform X2 [Babylonia areolata]